MSEKYRCINTFSVDAIDDEGMVCEPCAVRVNEGSIWEIDPNPNNMMVGAPETHVRMLSGSGWIEVDEDLMSGRFDRVEGGGIQ